MSLLSLGQKISNGELSVQTKLGNGAFGTVYKVYDNTKKETYALKEVICQNQNSINAVNREANTMAKAEHERRGVTTGGVWGGVSPPQSFETVHSSGKN